MIHGEYEKNLFVFVVACQWAVHIHYSLPLVLLLISYSKPEKLDIAQYDNSQESERFMKVMSASILTTDQTTIVSLLLLQKCIQMPYNYWSTKNNKKEPAELPREFVM